MTLVCKLCSNSNQIANLFGHWFEEDTQRNWLYLVLLATGVHIRKDDIVSKMVCQMCCELVEKLYKYRVQAVTNDKLLKNHLGQIYIPPLTELEELRRMGKQIFTGTGDENQVKVISNIVLKEKCNILKVYPKHSSVSDLMNKYPKVKLPKVVFRSDVAPTVALDAQEVNDWYAAYFQRYQQKLSSVNLTIKKLDSVRKCESIELKPYNKISTVPICKNVDFIKSSNTDTYTTEHITAPCLPVTDLLLTKEPPIDSTVLIQKPVEVYQEIGTKILPDVLCTQINHISTTTSEPVVSKQKQKARVNINLDSKLNKIIHQKEDCIKLADKSVLLKTIDASNDMTRFTTPYETNMYSVYVCVTCFKIYNTIKKLKTHQRQHINCKFCKLKIPGFKRLKIHQNHQCHVRILNNPPKLILRRVDEIQMVVDKYPDVFDYENTCAKDNVVDGSLSTALNLIEETMPQFKQTPFNLDTVPLTTLHNFSTLQDAGSNPEATANSKQLDNQQLSSKINHPSTIITFINHSLSTEAKGIKPIVSKQQSSENNNEVSSYSTESIFTDAELLEMFNLTIPPDNVPDSIHKTSQLLPIGSTPQPTKNTGVNSTQPRNTLSKSKSQIDKNPPKPTKVQEHQNLGLTNSLEWLQTDFSRPPTTKSLPSTGNLVQQFVADISGTTIKSPNAVKNCAHLMSTHGGVNNNVSSGYEFSQRNDLFRSVIKSANFLNDCSYSVNTSGINNNAPANYEFSQRNYLPSSGNNSLINQDKGNAGNPINANISKQNIPLNNYYLPTYQQSCHTVQNTNYSNLNTLSKSAATNSHPYIYSNQDNSKSMQNTHKTLNIKCRYSTNTILNNTQSSNFNTSQSLQPLDIESQLQSTTQKSNYQHHYQVDNSQHNAPNTTMTYSLVQPYSYHTSPNQIYSCPVGGAVQYQTNQYNLPSNQTPIAYQPPHLNNNHSVRRLQYQPAHTHIHNSRPQPYPTSTNRIVPTVSPNLPISNSAPTSLHIQSVSTQNISLPGPRKVLRVKQPWKLM